MFSHVSLTCLSAIAPCRTLRPVAIMRLIAVEEILAFMGLSRPASSSRDRVMGDRVIGTNDTEVSLQHNFGIGYRNLRGDTLQGDRAHLSDLGQHDLCHQLQSWLIHIKLEAIQGSSFSAAVGASLGHPSMGMSLIAPFKLAVSDICESSEYPCDLGFELNPDAEVDVKQPMSGRYRPSTIPA